MTTSSKLLALSILLLLFCLLAPELQGIAEGEHTEGSVDVAAASIPAQDAAASAPESSLDARTDAPDWSADE